MEKRTLVALFLFVQTSGVKVDLMTPDGVAQLLHGRIKFPQISLNDLGPYTSNQTRPKARVTQSFQDHPQLLRVHIKENSHAQIRFAFFPHLSPCPVMFTFG
jgi:hypothetical protein